MFMYFLRHINLFGKSKNYFLKGFGLQKRFYNTQEDTQTLEDIVCKIYKEQKKEKYINEDIQLLQKNQLKTVMDWKELTEEDKKIFPAFLRIILDEALGISKKQRNVPEKETKNDEWQMYVDSHGDIFIDKSEWKETRPKSDFANELLNSKEEELSNGVNRISMKNWIQENEEISPDIFTSISQRELWMEIYNYLENTKCSHSIVTGNPGIGKSRSLIYFLRILLKNGKKVILETKKDKPVYSFVPQKNGNYKVWECDRYKFFPASCALLKDSNAYYLIDPDQPISIASVSAHTILCISNRSHYNEYSKRPVTCFYLMPVWKKEELKSIQKYLPIDGKRLNDEEFEKRYYMFGGRIRFIFAQMQDYKKYRIKLQENIEKLTHESLLSTITIRGGNIIDDHSISPSMLYVYNTQLQEPTHFMKYNNFNITVASDYIRHYIVKKYSGIIMNSFDPNSQIYNGGIGHFFEILCSLILEIGGKFDVIDEKIVKNELILKKSISSEKIKGSWEEFLKKCSQLPFSSQESERKLYLPEFKNQPIIDVMDAKDRAYQITIWKIHRINLKHLQKMGNHLGFLKDDFHFNLYFVIPESQENMKFEFIGEVDVDKRVKEFEQKTIDELKIILKDRELNQNGNKDELIKILLEYDKINAETSEDIIKRLKSHLNIKFLIIPKNPTQQLDDIDMNHLIE